MRIPPPVQGGPLPLSSNPNTLLERNPGQGALGTVWAPKLKVKKKGHTQARTPGLPEMNSPSEAREFSSVLRGEMQPADRLWHMEQGFF